MSTILIIEDNQANMKLACLLLHSAGHEVLCAIDAETGLTLARSGRPDLILMDIQLPGMDGLAATALLKGDPETATIPVVALTAMAMKADEEKTRAAGCDGYIVKPLRYLDLYAVLDALLDRGQPRGDGHPAAFVPAGRAVSRSDRLPSQLRFPSRDEALRGRRLILVAEDNETNQKVILRQLALLGYAADMTGDGSLALQAWQSGDYALLLTDVQMPNMDGFELVEAIRASECTAGGGLARTPIVVMTASSSKCGRQPSAADIDGYLCKPLQRTELKVAMAAWLPMVGSAVATEDELVAGGTRQVLATLDVNVLRRLVGSKPSVVDEFLSDFQVSAATIASALKVACLEHQARPASRQAHKLKSSARSVGALALGDLCAQMEAAGNEDDTQALSRLLPLFEQQWLAANACIDALPRRAAAIPGEG